MLMASTCSARCYFLFAIGLVLSVSLLHPISCNAQYFFVFGDSLYDPGNNQYITPNETIPSYYPPYGTTFFNNSTGRYSDGRIVADFIAVKLNLPFLPPVLDPKADFTHGASFASGGAGVFDNNSNALNFGKQIEKFKEVADNWTMKLGPDEANKRLRSAVYLICIGGNDYFSYFHSGGNRNATVPEQQAFVDMVVGNMTDMLQEVYQSGGRKFMLQTVAPIGCLPMMKQELNLEGNACVGKTLVLAELHNAALRKAAEKLQTELRGFVYSIFDYFKAVGERINNPTAYGFKKGDVACCGVGAHRANSCGSATEDFETCFNPDEYVFFDGGHNSDHANFQLSELMWEGGADVVAPFNMRVLFHLDSTVNTPERNQGRPLMNKLQPNLLGV